MNLSFRTSKNKKMEKGVGRIQIEHFYGEKGLSGPAPSSQTKTGSYSFPNSYNMSTSILDTEGSTYCEVAR